VVDLNATPPFQAGVNYWVISTVYDGGTDANATIATATQTTLNNAYVASMSGAAIDTDRWASYSPGFYQDNALYFGYTQKNPSSANWRRGGVLRLVTNEDPNPANWTLSKVFESSGSLIGSRVGPISTGIARLQDRKNHNLWLYFGTGRYYYSKDDFNTARQLFGIKEPCYKNAAPFYDTIDPACAVKYTPGQETDQTSGTATVNNVGWSILLEGITTDANGDQLGAERVITDPVAMTNGAVFFTSYKPNSNFCQFGGYSYLWAVKYDTGGQAPDAALQGKALVQVSTGEFKEINLSTVFTDKGYRRMGTAMTGKPPEDPPPIISKSNNKPVKRIIHLQER
jgi:type IV pilus assembly protein PilY1